MKTIELDGIVWELPYWDLLPALSAPLFLELKEDILDKAGNIYPVIWSPARTHSGTPRQVIDGGHRLQAVAELRSEGHRHVELSADCIDFGGAEEERQAALDLNIKRRHLTPEQRAEWIAKLRQEGRSIRQIAESVGASVGTVHKELSTVQARTVELPSVVVGKDGKERQATRPAPSPAGEREAPLPLEVSQDPAFIAESVERSFAKSGPLHPTTLLPSEPPATTAPREAADSDEGQEVVLFDGDREYRPAQEDELRAEIDRLKSELALATKKKGVLPATAERDDHNTPPEILEVVREFACGRITLDPCWNEHAQTDPLLSLDKERDGLNADWARVVDRMIEHRPSRVVVFVNPPYDIDTLYAVGDHAATQGQGWLEVITLVPVKADQDWFQDVIEVKADAICFINGRVRFWADGKQQQGAAFPCCLCYYGRSAARFCEVFSQLGACVDLEKQRGQ